LAVGGSEICVLVANNPKRPGTAAYAKFSVFRDGMTVASYLAAPGDGGTGEIRWCLAHGYISLEDRHTEA